MKNVKPRLQEKYEKEVLPALKKEFGLKNPWEAPRVKKVVVNAGIGGFRDNKEAVASFTQELAELCGQRPYATKARLSEAGFKIKRGDVVGLAVTLRGAKMWAFLDKLINVALPRVRDFRGLSEKAFDKSGNYSMGIREHAIFPEVNSGTTKGIRSFQASVVLDKDDAETNRALLDYLGFPFINKREKGE